MRESSIVVTGLTSAACSTTQTVRKAPRLTADLVEMTYWSYARDGAVISREV
jgi:hypothetical protein